jgi:hypothetical protein
MRSTSTKSTLFALTLLLLGLTVPALAAPARCSTASAAGDWAYSYSGTILLPTGPVPVATVGRFTTLANGTFSGTQTRSVGGDVAVETVTGTFHEKADCTVTYTANVYQGGTLLRTATLATVTSNNGRTGRGIFTSLTLADGTNLPNVITIESERIFPDQN